MTRRKAGATSWEKAWRIQTDLQSSAGNPTLYEDGDNNRLWMLFSLIHGNYHTDSVVFSASSDDQGKTWTQPTKVWPDRGHMIRHSPIRAGKHQIILPAYNERTNQSQIYVASMPGPHWQFNHNFDAKLIQPVITRVGEEDLVAFFRPTGEPKIIWRARSTDNGSSWSTLIRTTLPCPLSGLSAFAIEDRIAVVHNHTTEHRRYPLSISVSKDSGVTWIEPWHIDTSEHEVSYPNYIVARDGMIHGMHTVNRRMIRYLCFSPEELISATD